jgi:hypothetical protein
MTKETLLFAFQNERLKVATDCFTVPEDRDATFMVAGTGETIQIGKVVKIEMRESALCLETGKGERYWFSYDLILGVRLRSAQNAKDHTTGFTR